MDKIENLELEVEELKKQMAYLIKNSSEGGSDPDNPGDSGGNTGTSTGDWVTIYDMLSADAAINIGYTSGIIASTGLLSDMADLNPYSYLKIYYHANKNYYVQIFELTEVTKTDRAGYCLNLINNEVTGIIAQGLFLELDDAGAKRLRVANGRYIQMVSSKVWTISSLSSGTYQNNYYITKILAK